MIISVLEHGIQQDADSIPNLDYTNAEDPSDFHRTYKNSEEIQSWIRSEIITATCEHMGKGSYKQCPSGVPTCHCQRGKLPHTMLILTSSPFEVLH